MIFFLRFVTRRDSMDVEFARESSEIVVVVVVVVVGDRRRRSSRVGRSVVPERVVHRRRTRAGIGITPERGDSESERRVTDAFESVRVATSRASSPVEGEARRRRVDRCPRARARAVARG